MSAAPAPLSPWRLVVRILLVVALVNIFAVRAGDPRLAIYFDLVMAVLAGALFVASRLWPDKIWPGRRG